ncbi:cadherin repeat domain-containing protein [Tamlana sp. 62-3]|uniref:Cadherin repeat domain-containing protein n=1 Tax=Neotamlana sargassicola TaxID=2883125 RepID=A0A9X1I6N4_9FLAO|nr:cadherin repeat domain-containing protein [Tamlana sargassicola]MCB4807166.1 cadherin repeat domain-containing protein [Tamlana sargassicola]
MKATRRLKFLWATLLLIVVFACSKDEDKAGINVQNFIANFDENPTNGDAVGTIQAVGSGTLSFSITSQIPSGALSVNPSTGALSVADASLFDFETNPIISAEVTIIDVSNTETASVTINLNDLDDIESFLSSSKASYVAASAGEWIAVTETEYNALATNLNEITKVATSDKEYDYDLDVERSSTEFTIANNNGHTIPASSYIIAFKFHAITNSSTNKVLISTTHLLGPYTQLGNNLPTTTTGDQFYVIKGNNTTAEGYLGFYNSDQMGFKRVPTSISYGFHSSESLTLLSEIFDDARIVLYQGLSTTQKQW